MNKAHKSYSIPLETVKQIIRNSSGVKDLDSIINGAIKSYIHCHGNDLTNKNITSLRKRIVGAFKEHYSRLILDRYIVNWLTTNRIDLSHVDGELRNGLVKLMLDNVDKA